MNPDDSRTSRGGGRAGQGGESAPSGPTGVTLFLLAGTAGSGKSTALKALEDAGVSCVDNLPVSLVPHFLEYLRGGGKPLSRVPGMKDRYALLLNCYTLEAVHEVLSGIEALKKDPLQIFLIFFDARDEILIQRFRETRRPHPIKHVEPEITSLRDSIQKERETLAPLRNIANKVIDTSSDSPHDLRRRMQDLLSFQPSLEISLVSFGFKYGIPFDADLVFDVRFLPNPYFETSMRDRTGRDDDVRSLVMDNDDARELVQRTQDLIAFLLPRFRREGKRYLTIAIGCTGGKHRSVAVVEAIAAFLETSGHAANVRHRDIERA